MGHIIEGILEIIFQKIVPEKPTGDHCIPHQAVIKETASAL